MKLFFLTCFFLVGLSANSQIKFDVKVSSKHLQKVEQQKDAREKLKSYKKFYQKDSVKAAKKEWKTFKKDKRDSLKREGIWKEAKANKKKVLTNKWEAYTNKIPEYNLDSISFPDPKDSLDWAMQELAKQKNWRELQSIYEQVAQYDSSYLDRFHLDSIKIDTTELINRFQLKERVSKYLPEELREQTDFELEDKLKHGFIDEFGGVKLMDQSGVKEFFQNVDPEQFAKSQLSLTTLKDKYVKLPDLSKEEEGIKRNSLKGTPAKKRWYTGGHFAIQSTDPVIVDANIRLGYKLNKKLSIGSGLVLREQFGNDSTSLLGDAFGFSPFVNYQITKDFFVLAEVESMKDGSMFEGAEKDTNWQQAYYLGMGRTFRFSSKVSASVTFLYDFNYQHNSLNVRPFVVRVGYKINL
jgi:hypothetical protein